LFDHLAAARAAKELFAKIIKEGQEEEGEQIVGEGAGTRDTCAKDEGSKNEIVEDPDF